MDIDCEVDRSTQHALLQRVYRHTGIAMPERKWTLLQGRLRRRLQALSLESYQDYLGVLENRPDELSHFINLVTTNETSFFRTPRIWDYLWQVYLPHWHAAHPGGTLQIWSAAASTGEEAYSLAMLCEEYRERHPGFRYRILATDIATDVLQVGQRGRYGGRNVEGLRKSRPAMLEKYFCATDGEAEVLPALRSNISFREHHLHKRMEGGVRVDLALLRNVLIYFDEEGQQVVLENVRRAMVNDGVLIIGESESLGRFKTGFEFEQPLIYRNRTGHARGP
ncbi:MULTISPECIES: CheR family methyltransferase [Dyella]|uniref:protein-glutamate O-methyltransferase n=2 Tax=Dyella TaxID=231454 RepID=A0A4R0YV40_9GAMM|nr:MULTISPECIES: protein-glutamate O-methyltransferase CheR [Dyella]TBR40076.1 protein-glutamate O-methyltransferase CheR [Dyella terrae]TCI12341.1 protein-glutamate O-methyltransferase CheR [Dyella soli]